MGGNLYQTTDVLLQLNQKFNLTFDLKRTWPNTSDNGGVIAKLYYLDGSTREELTSQTFILNTSSGNFPQALNNSLEYTVTNSAAVNKKLGVEFINKSWGPVYVTLDNIRLSSDQKLVTPAIGLELSQDGTELTWTVEDEIGVKKYHVINAETKEVLEVVLAVDADFYSVEVPEGIEVELVVVDESGFSKPYAPQDGNVKIEIYDLEEGWNLIAITSDDADLETLKDETVGVLWGWNSASYEVIETAKATDAVWVYSPIEKQVHVSGTKSDAKIKLNLGWNMVGPVENDYIPEGADTVYSWSEVYDIIAGKKKILIGGKGYWIFSL